MKYNYLSNPGSNFNIDPSANREAFELLDKRLRVVRESVRRIANLVPSTPEEDTVREQTVKARELAEQERLKLVAAAQKYPNMLYEETVSDAAEWPTHLSTSNDSTNSTDLAAKASNLATPGAELFNLFAKNNEDAFDV